MGRAAAHLCGDVWTLLDPYIGREHKFVFVRFSEYLGILAGRETVCLHARKLATHKQISGLARCEWLARRLQKRMHASGHKSAGM
jgi:hypothetical protein